MHITARRRDTIAQDLGHETMVFDSVRGEYHLLNPLAAFVFRHANGETAEGDLLTLAREQFGSELGTTDIELAVDELQRVSLLEAPETRRAARPAISRRDAARRMAALALSAPLVTSLLAPEPAMAASVDVRPKGNNGVGNGVDPCPPGIGNCGNDAPGQTPGNPGGNDTAPGQIGGNPHAPGQQKKKDK